MATFPIDAVVSVILLFGIGIAAGYLVKHTFKWALIIVGVIIVILVLGFVSIAYLISIGNQLQPVFKSIANAFQTYLGLGGLSAGTIAFIIGAIIGIVKL